MSKAWILLVFSLGLSARALGASWYVDSTAAAGGDGTSWTKAWRNVDDVTGVAPGDVVYVSGGPCGTSQTYSLTNWQPAQGSAGSPVTYQIGQDSDHDGTAIFKGQPDAGDWINEDLSNLVITGQAPDGLMHFAVQD
jgi:hypothetical protein